MLEASTGIRRWRWGQWVAAFSAPRPVFERTRSSLNLWDEDGSWLRNVPKIAPRKPSGMLRMPGFSSGKSGLAWKRWRAAPVTVGGSIFIKLGLTRISPMEAKRPTARPATTPAVLKRRQKRERTMTGRFAEAATAKARATRKATLAVGPSRMAMLMATAPTTKAEMR